MTKVEVLAAQMYCCRRRTFSPGHAFTVITSTRSPGKRPWKIVWMLLTFSGLAIPQQVPSENPLLQAAVQGIERRDFAAAQELIRKVLTSDPKSSPAHNLLGICQVQTGEYEEAKKSFQTAIELNPKFATAHVNLGNLLIRIHDDTSAIKEFKAAIAIEPEILTRDPASFVAFNVFGLCLMADRKYEEARRAFERAIRINPKYVPAHVNLGHVLVALGQDAMALKAFLAAVAIQPNDFHALKNIGLIYGRQARFDLAVTYLGQARQRAPGDPETAVALAEAEISGGKHQEARRLVDELAKAGQLHSKSRETLGLLWLDNGEPLNAADLVRDDPDLSVEFYKLGYEKAESEFDAGHYPEAKKILEMIRDLQTPDAAFHDLLGSVCYAIDDPKKASQEFQEAVRLEPADPEHYFKLGMVFLKHHTPEPAIYVYETAIKSRPDVPKLWLGLGLSYYIGSRLEDAEQALRKALAFDPQYDIVYIVLGDLLEQTGRTADALDVFRKAIERHPRLYLSYYYYGKLASKQGHENILDAIEKLRKAIDLKPNFPEAHYELGKALAQAGKTAEAVQQLNKSLELKSELAQSHYQLARIYKKLDDPVRSSQHMRLFEQISKKEKPEDLIRRLEVQIETP
jgi:tetratricopeptide (TPR) repeat protein